MILSHKTVVISERDKAQAEYFPWVKDKLKLITIGLKPPTFYSVDGAKQAIGRIIGLDITEYNKKIPIVCIAELHPNKNQKDLVEAMVLVTEQQTNALCVMISDGDDKESLRNLINERKLENKVFLTGHIDNASEYLKAFSIFVLPSVKEGLPYVILEAGCASLPVVATTVGGIPEIIEDMKSGILIQPRNPRELAHAISFMIEHPEERRRYGIALKERVAAKFSLEKMISAIQELYLTTAVQ